MGFDNWGKAKNYLDRPQGLASKLHFGTWYVTLTIHPRLQQRLQYSIKAKSGSQVVKY